MKLYSVMTTVEEYSGCKNVIFRWFRGPQGRRPYADLIKDYEPGNPAETFVEELFTWDEALQLETYLDQYQWVDTVIEEATLPVESDTLPFDLKVGDSFCMLSEEPEYSLPFKVVGLFNLDGCPLIDGSEAVKEAAAQMLDDVVAKYRERRR
jgi:hypothetical protein